MQCQLFVSEHTRLSRHSRAQALWHHNQILKIQICKRDQIQTIQIKKHVQKLMLSGNSGN